MTKIPLMTRAEADTVYEGKQSTYRATNASDERASVNAFLAAGTPLGVKQIIGSISVSDKIDVPSNTYLDLSTATITQTGTSKVTIDLFGVSNVTIYGGRLVGTFVHVPGSAASVGVNVRGGCSNITISDLTATGHGGVGIKIDSSSNCIVRGARVTGTTPPASTGSAGSEVGILVEGTSTRIQLIECFVTATSQGISSSVASSDLAIRGCQVYNITGQHGMYLQSSSDVIVSDNIVDGCALVGIKYQINDTVAADVTRIIISGNTINNTGSHGILISNAAAAFTYYFRDVTVTGNTITSTVEDGINLHSAKDAVVADNTIRLVTRHGIVITNCNDTNVTNNLLHTIGQIGVLLNSGAGTVINRIRVADNTIQDPATANVSNNDYGIDIKLGTDVSVLRNTVRDSAVLMRYGLFFEGGDQPSFRARGNMFIGATDYGARVQLSTAVKEWNDNICSGTLGNVLNLTVTLVTRVGGVGVNDVYQSSAVPSTGTFLRGDICWNSAPSASGPPGWVCTTAGSPGTWKAMANLAA